MPGGVPSDGKAGLHRQNKQVINLIERVLDLLRGLVVELNLAVVIVTHDLGVARLLANRLLVMKQGQVVESGLTDRVLDDPHHPYTQLLVSSVLQN